MHNKKARTTIDLADGPTSLHHKLPDLRGDQVYAGDIEADYPRCLFGNCHIVEMDFIRAVDRDPTGTYVAGAHQEDTLAGRRNILRTEALLLCQRNRALIKGDASLVLYTARGVGIAQLHQLAQRVRAIPCDVSRQALSGSDKETTHNENPVVASGNKFLDQDRARACLL